MTIKKTQKHGFTLSNKRASLIFNDSGVKIVRNEKAEGKETEYEITEPGEYELESISVHVEPIEHDGTPTGFMSYFIGIDNFTVGYINYDNGELTSENIAHFEQVDVLFIPGKLQALAKSLAPSFVVAINNEQALAEKLGKDLPEARNSFTLKTTSDLPEETEILFFS